MKKTLFIFSVLISLAFSAIAQDTVPLSGSMYEGYYYYNDYNRFTGSPLSVYGGIDNGGEWAKRFYTEDTLTVYGIAVGILDGLEYYARQELNVTNLIYDTSYDHAYEYVRLYEPCNDSLHWILQQKVHLHSTPIAYYADYSTTSHPNQIVTMYERFFNAPQKVCNVFYVGTTFYNNARHDGWDYTYIPLKIMSLRSGSIQYGDSMMYCGTTYHQWHRKKDNGIFKLIFPILLPAPADYEWDTIASAGDTTTLASDTVAAGDTLIVCDTVVVCDTLIVGYDTIVRYDTIVNYDTLLALPERGLLGRLVGVMPNPATETAKVVSSFGLTMVESFNMAGEKVHTLRLPDAPLTATLDVRRWPSGTYLLRIRTPQGTAVKKLVVR